MPSFERCPKEVRELAGELIQKYEDHSSLDSARVMIDFVFAYGDRDENDNLTGDALTKGGVRALGIARKVPPKDRALGRGDAEIALDGDWWKDASPEQQAALLDHELHHLTVKMTRGGVVSLDQQGRPKIKLRQHDYEFGWFTIIAQRHGASSIECDQAARIFDEAGQAYWPSIAGAIKGQSRSRVQRLEVARQNA